ncbi:DUF4252 domain-containing protein [Flavobacteriaceae bacterium R38]|nr:DUF4252 domain-containing protein [Flavobacteriaceae bacterium R38]
MRKLILITLFIVTPLVTFGQSIFDKFEDSDDVTTVVVTKKMFDLFSRISSDDPDTKDAMEMIKSLTGLKIFTTESKSVAADMKATVDRYLKSSSLDELMRVKDEDVNVKFYIKEGRDADHVKELLMFVTGIKDVEANGKKIETVLLTLTGDIDLNRISSLMEQMDLPSELGNVNKRKN